MAPPDLTKSKVIVIGTGVFGISTTIALAKKYPTCQITVIDRYEPPVQDATSVDTTRCIRYDYRNPMYGRLALESMNIIKSDPVISEFFKQCGMTMLYDGKSGSVKDTYVDEKRTATSLAGEEKIVQLETPEKIFKSVHGQDAEPPTAETLGRPLQWIEGYTNTENGVIDAEGSIKAYYERAKEYKNVKFIFTPVEKILYEGKKSTGVGLQDGSVIHGDLVVVAAGAWTSKLVDITQLARHFCYEVVYFKLTTEEVERFKNMPITTNLSTGINIFPPLNGYTKVLQRSPGYVNTVTLPNPDPEDAVKNPTITISHPRTLMTSPKDWIPEKAEVGIREQMREMMPFLADRPFARTKLCWLTRTDSGNFLIDHHPKYENVILATCGTGHAWKFVPILGDKVIDRINGTLDAEMAEKWSWAEKLAESDLAHSDNTPRLPGIVSEMEDVVRQMDAHGSLY